MHVGNLNDDDLNFFRLITGSANETQVHTQVIHTQLRQESDSQMRFFYLAAESEERERRGPLMLQLQPHSLGKQTRMNISVRRSLWAPMVGAWHT